MVLSVIIVSYNTRELLRQCLNSVFKQTKGISFEVIVVDNHSQDGSVAMVKKKFPRVKLLAKKKNLGFAAGNNQGIKISKGKYILLLNPDTELTENSLKKMVGWMEENKKVGVSSCQLTYEDKTIQNNGGHFPNLLRIFNWMFFIDDLPFIKAVIPSFHPHEPQSGWLSSRYFQEKHFQDWVTGSFFLIRKEMIEQIGPLDEKFFMYVEEVEFCYRAKRAGWLVAYVPITKIIHSVQKSGSQELARLSEYRGLIYFFKKHKAGWQLPILKIFLKVGALLRLLVFGIMRNNPEMRRIYAQAFKID